MEIQLIPFHSELWDIFKGAYGNVCEEVKIIMNKENPIPVQEKIRRLDTEEKNDYEIAFDNLCENLTHQMTFYDANYIVFPYLLTLLIQKENQNDFGWQLKLITEMGICLATDIYENDFNDEYSEITENYYNCVSVFQEKTKAFLKEHFEEIKNLENYKKNEFVTALMAILGDRKLAYILVLNYWEEVYYLCDKCEYCDEDSSLDDKEFISKITLPKETEWDGKSYNNIYAWYTNLLKQLGADDEANYITHLFGRYSCPECNNTKTLLEFMKNYSFGE